MQESLAINNQKPQRMALTDSSGAQDVNDKAAKNRARKLRAKAKATESRALAQAASKHKGDGEGKGDNKGPKKRNDTEDGLTICFNYNKGKCTNAACIHQHV